MNLQLFGELMEQGPDQHPPEWRMFLEFCEMYLKKHEIGNPIVVEIGTWKNKQKKFYEQLLGVRHIGIDLRRGAPDILGDAHDPKTMEILKEMLGGKPINILFIDAWHFYKHVKKDYELYSPLCTDIVAFHDTEACRYENNEKIMAWKFWDELKMKMHIGEEGYKDFITISIYKYRIDRNQRQMGIGVLIKKCITPKQLN